MKHRLSLALCLTATVAIASNVEAGLFSRTGCTDSGCGQGCGLFDGLCNSGGCAGNKCAADGCTDHGCGESGCGLFGCGGCSLLGANGLIKPSDHCFDDFISPMINFVYFEDPRSVSEIRPIFVNHWVPGTIGTGGAVTAGGTVQLYALQFRARLTDRLSLIAVKDGFIVDNTNGTLDTVLNDGFADVTAGLKYNLLSDSNSGTLLSTGFTYEIPIGSQSALQDVGDGEFHFFLTGGQRFLDGDLHLLSSVGYRLPVDNDSQSTSIHWSNHIDYRVTEKAYVFTELAWWHFVDDAGAGLPGIAGQDLFNLTATGVEGQSLVTQSVGMKFKPNANTEVGVAYEFPLSDFEDIISSRLMFDLILRF